MGPETEDVNYLRLSRGELVRVDREDWNRFSGSSWSAWKTGRMRTRYARSNRKLMHREVVNAPKGLVCDHINGNGLDNRKSNIRLCSQGENVCNSRKRTTNKSGHKGVCWNKSLGYWMSRVQFQGKCKAKYFKEYEDACADYRIRALETHGEFARVS